MQHCTTLYNTTRHATTLKTRQSTVQHSQKRHNRLAARHNTPATRGHTPAIHCHTPPRTTPSQAGKQRGRGVPGPPTRASLRGLYRFWQQGPPRQARQPLHTLPGNVRLHEQRRRCARDQARYLTSLSPLSNDDGGDDGGREEDRRQRHSDNRREINTTNSGKRRRLPQVRACAPPAANYLPGDPWGASGVRHCRLNNVVT